MLGRVIADEVIREAKRKSGRTKPVLMLCEADSDGAVEVFCKLSAGCFEGVTSLAREVVAACLAIDLNLPVPTPYLVEIPSTLASVATDPDIAERLGASSPIGFGSAKIENQFSVWNSGNHSVGIHAAFDVGGIRVRCRHRQRRQKAIEPELPRRAGPPPPH